jgi:transcriptional regulator with XRE-family HTH domain
MELGEIIREHRKRRNLSQSELAKLADVDPSFISRIEKGDYKLTSVKSLQGLSRALKIKIEELTGAIVSNKLIIKDAPPRSIYEITKELQTTLIEVPVVAELHMPGEIVEYIYIPRVGPGQANYVGVKAKGYCLAPDIMDGDTVIIDQDAAPEVGKTILCYHNGREHPELFKMKRSGQVKDCEIYGVVVGIFRRM